MRQIPDGDKPEHKLGKPERPKEAQDEWFAVPGKPELLRNKEGKLKTRVTPPTAP